MKQLDRAFGIFLPPWSPHQRSLLPPDLTVLSFLIELRHSPNAIPFLSWHVADAFIYKYQCYRTQLSVIVRVCITGLEQRVCVCAKIMRKFRMLGLCRIRRRRPGWLAINSQTFTNANRVLEPTTPRQYIARDFHHALTFCRDFERTPKKTLRQVEYP